MRRAVVLLVSASLSVALVGCSATGERAGAWVSTTPDASSTSPKASASSSGPVGSTARPFTSPDGYSLIPPAGWTESPGGAGRGLSVVFIAPAVNPPAKFVENINVVVNPAQKNLQSTIAETKQALPTFLTHYRVVIDEPTTANGQEAHLLGGTFDQGTGHLENLQLILIADGTQYTVTFTSPAATFKTSRQRAQTSLLSLHLV